MNSPNCPRLAWPLLLVTPNVVGCSGAVSASIKGDPPSIAISPSEHAHDQQSQPLLASMAQQSKLTIVATAEEEIRLFRSGDEAIAVSVNGMSLDFTYPPQPSVALISVESCLLLGGEDELPPLGRQSLNRDLKRRWGIELEAPQRVGPPNEGTREVAGAGITRSGYPWIAFHVSKRFERRGAIDIYLRVDEKWSLYWSKMVRVKSLVATSSLDENSDTDIVGIEADWGAAGSATAKTFVHEWKFQKASGSGKPPTITDRTVALNCFENPTEIAAFGNLSVLSVGMTPNRQLAIEEIDPTTRRVARTEVPGLFAEDRDFVWGIQPLSAEAFTFSRVGLPAYRFQREGDSYVGRVAPDVDRRVRRILEAYPETAAFTVLPNGRPIALVVADNLWKLVSDEPVASPCRFPWHPERQGAKTDG